jgi:hypothetical protein
VPEYSIIITILCINAVLDQFHFPIDIFQTGSGTTFLTSTERRALPEPARHTIFNKIDVQLCMDAFGGSPPTGWTCLWSMVSDAANAVARVVHILQKNPVNRPRRIFLDAAFWLNS